MTTQFKVTIKRKDAAFTLSCEPTWNVLLSTLTEHFPKESPSLLYYYNPDGLLVSLFDDKGLKQLLSSDCKEVHIWSDPTEALSAKLPLSETSESGQTTIDPATDISSSIVFEKLGTLIDSYQPDLQDDSVISYAIGNLLTVLLKRPNSVDFASFERWLKLVSTESQKSVSFENKTSSSSSSSSSSSENDSSSENENEPLYANNGNPDITSFEIPDQSAYHRISRHHGFHYPMRSQQRNHHYEKFSPSNPSESEHGPSFQSFFNQESRRHGKGHRGSREHHKNLEHRGHRGHHKSFSQSKGESQEDDRDFSCAPTEDFGKRRGFRHHRSEDLTDCTKTSQTSGKCCEQRTKRADKSDKHSGISREDKKHRKHKHHRQERSRSPSSGFRKAETMADQYMNIAKFLRKRAALVQESCCNQKGKSSECQPYAEPASMMDIDNSNSNSDSSDTESSVWAYLHRRHRFMHGGRGIHGGCGKFGGLGGLGGFGGFGLHARHGRYGKHGKHGGLHKHGMHRGFGKHGMFGGFGGPGAHRGFGRHGAHHGFGGPGGFGGFGRHGAHHGFGGPGSFGGFGRHGAHHGFGGPGSFGGFGRHGAHHGFGGPGSFGGFGRHGARHGFGGPGGFGGFGRHGAHHGFGGPGGFGSFGRHGYISPFTLGYLSDPLRFGIT
ncbi:hypothetical protein F4703DRAFT_1918975 [Phycomyces blakesleeanus]